LSIETDFVAVAQAWAPLTALVGDRVSQHAAGQGTPLPIVVFAASHLPQEGLDGDVQIDEFTIVAECWGDSASSAGQVADELTNAINAHDAASGALSVTATSRQSVYDEELELDGYVLAFQWMRL